MNGIAGLAGGVAWPATPPTSWVIELRGRLPDGALRRIRHYVDDYVAVTAAWVDDQIIGLEHHADDLASGILDARNRYLTTIAGTVRSYAGTVEQQFSGIERRLEELGAEVVAVALRMTTQAGEVIGATVGGAAGALLTGVASGVPWWLWLVLAAGAALYVNRITYRGRR